MIATRTSFGRLLRDARLRAGLTQEELSLYSGLGMRTVSDLERDRVTRPHRRTVDALVTALNLDGARADAFRAAARNARDLRTEPGESRQRAGCPMEVWGLPADLTDFVGRQAELDRLLSWADRVVDLGYPPVIISGGPGMGKTSFAVHAGHRLAARFPDGQIFVDLRGAKPHETLGTLLCALGVPEGELPSSLEQRTGLFRVLARDRSVLFVLDNAEDEAQVRPLLAGGGRSLFILASRRTLAGLDAGRRIPLARFGREESLTLLGLIAGWHRVDAQPREATEVARACGRLPLALRIAGNRLAVRPGWAFRDLAHRLRDERTRLSWLVAGDLAMRPALRTSYDRLGPTAQRLFRRLSIAPDGIATVPVAAALLEPDGDCAELVLEELVDASLLASTPSPDRYRLEGPLRLLAHELLHQQEPVSLVFRLFAEMGATAPFGGAAVTSAPRSSSPSLLPSGRFAS